jgi:hypothetical protein
MDSKLVVLSFLLLNLIFCTQSNQNQNEVENILKFHLEAESINDEPLSDETDVTKLSLESLNKLIESKDKICMHTIFSTKN